jgi:hypothetical protein
MGHLRTHLAAANAAVANRFLAAGTAMKVGAYAVANSGAMPTEGARHVTITHTAVGAADTLGTITFTGRSLAGETISEEVTPTSGGVATGAKWFASVTGMTGAGWATNTGDDTISIGCGSEVIVSEGNGDLHGIAVNTTAAGAITLADAAGTIAVLKASIPEDLYEYGVRFGGYLKVTLAAASDVTVIHTGSMPGYSAG